MTSTLNLQDDAPVRGRSVGNPSICSRPPRAEVTAAIRAAVRAYGGAPVTVPTATRGGPA